MISVFLLCLALCVDIFVAGVIYGTEQIRIPLRINVVMNAVGTVCLGAALCFGTVISLFVPAFLTDAVCVVSLSLLGVTRLLDSLIKNYIHRHCGVHKKIHFSFSELNVILQIYADPGCADHDNDRHLSVKESVFLGLAMSIDSFAVGTFAAFMEIPVGWTLLFSFLSGILAMVSGEWIGGRLTRHWKADLTWVGGIFFLLLAILKIAG